MEGQKLKHRDVSYLVFVICLGVLSGCTGSALPEGEEIAKPVVAGGNVSPKASEQKKAIALNLKRGIDEIPAEVTFPLKNIGKAPLVIYEGKASCGCTAVTVSKPVLQPGEECEVLLALEQEVFFEDKVVNAALTTNDPDTGVIEIELSVRWTEPIQFFPGNLINLGNHPIEKPLTLEITIVQNFGNTSMEIERVSLPEFTRFESTLTHLPDEEARSAYLLKLDANKIDYAGSMNETVLLHTNIHDKPLEVKITGFIAGDIIPEPKIVYLGAAKTGDTRVRTIRLEYKEGIALSDVSLESGQALGGVIAVQRDDDFKLVVQITVPEDPSFRDALLVASTAGVKTRIPIVIDRFVEQVVQTSSKSSCVVSA